MKIIDKNKDYYDYLQGIWGQDLKATYRRQDSVIITSENRPPFMAKELPDDVHAYQGYIVLTCGFVEHYIYIENTREGLVLEEFWKRIVTRPKNEPPLMIVYYVNRWYRNCPKSAFKNWRKMPSKEDYIQGIVNHYTQKPNPNVFHRLGWNYLKLHFEDIVGGYNNPILMSFPLTVVPTEDVFIGIQDYLLSQYDTEIKDNRTDVEKLEAAGFDRITSFRKPK